MTGIRQVRFLILTVLVLMTAVLALMACGTDGEPTVEPSPVTTSVTVQESPTPAVQTTTPTATPMSTATPVPTATRATPTPVTVAPPATVNPTSAPTPSPPAVPTPATMPMTTPTPPPTPVPYPEVPGIVDVSNRGWPREVETVEGVIRLEEPPERILTYSIGHDELVLSLVASDRMAAIGKFTTNDSYSNVVGWVTDIAVYEKGAENVLAQEPDLFIASKFTKADIVDLIKESGVPVVRPSLENSSEGNIPNILLLGYLLGAEERALELAAEIQERLTMVSEKVLPADDSSRPDVIAITRYSEKIYVPGSGTTEGGIIEAAGGVNAATREGLEGIQKVSIESVVSMNPEVILITQTGESGGGALREDLLQHPALVAVPAVVNNRIHVVGSKTFTTLSHWNVRGIEEAAMLLYPDQFAGTTFVDFQPYDGE